MGMPLTGDRGRGRRAQLLGHGRLLCRAMASPRSAASADPLHPHPGRFAPLWPAEGGPCPLRAVGLPGAGCIIAGSSRRGPTMTGHACPECGRRTAGEPGTEHRVPCRCGAVAGSAPLTEDEQRAARTAEIAAAEDFDPLRIRPYVTLTDRAGGRPDHSGSGHDVPGCGRHHDAAVPGRWWRRRLGRRYGYGYGPRNRCGGGSGRLRRRVRGTGRDRNRQRGPEPQADRRREPRLHPGPRAAAPQAALRSARRGSGGGRGGRYGGLRRRAVRRRRQRGRGAAGGDHERPGPGGRTGRFGGPVPLRVGHCVPYAVPLGRTVGLAPSASASPTRSREPSPTATASASPTTSASPTPEDGGAPTSSPSAAPPAEFAGPALRPGDRGPEVGVLQNRLKEVWSLLGALRPALRRPGGERGGDLPVVQGDPGRSDRRVRAEHAARPGGGDERTRTPLSQDAWRARSGAESGGGEPRTG